MCPTVSKRNACHDDESNTRNVRGKFIKISGDLKQKKSKLFQISSDLVTITFDVRTDTPLLPQASEERSGNEPGDPAIQLVSKMQGRVQLTRARAAALQLQRRWRCTAATENHQPRRDAYRAMGYPQTTPAQRNQKTMGPYELPGEPRRNYPKRRSPLKRSTALIHALGEEECLRMIHNGRAVFPKKIPNPMSGDVIRITYVSDLSNPNMKQCFTGICIAVRRRGLGSTVVLRNVVDGVPFERGFPMYSPLIQDAEILGKRRVRRAKLYYLRDKPIRESTVPDATKVPRK